MKRNNLLKLLVILLISCSPILSCSSEEKDPEPGEIQEDLSTYELEYVSGDGQTYGGGGSPYPLVFKIKKMPSNTYVTNLNAAQLVLFATAEVGNQDTDFETIDYCGESSQYCFGSYFYLPPEVSNMDVHINVNLKKHGIVHDTYEIVHHIN